jgi:hypothetical protein
VEEACQVMCATVPRDTFAASVDECTAIVPAVFGGFVTTLTVVVASFVPPPSVTQWSKIVAGA